MSLKALTDCARNQPRYTKRDALIGAGVMLAATLIFSVAAFAARRADWPVTSAVFLSLAFPGSLTISMPFWLTKGQSWRWQVVIAGGTLAILVAIGYLSTII